MTWVETKVELEAMGIKPGLHHWLKWRIMTSLGLAWYPTKDGR